MKTTAVRFRKLTSILLLALCCAALAAARPASAAYASPAWQSSAIIYCIYPQIFSSRGLSGIAGALPRLKSLGGSVAKNTLTPPTPYDQDDPQGIDPAHRTAADLHALVSAAHAAGMHVILDVAANQTAWSSPLVQQHPEYYYHTDNKPKNVNSVEPASPTASATPTSPASISTPTGTARKPTSTACFPTG